MRTITITAALKELKLYDEKINKKISNAVFVDCGKKVSDNVGHKKKDDFINDSKADFQSIKDLIAERSKIKAEIVKSNAETVVNVAGIEMTRAEAIERKSSIIYDKKLLLKLKHDYSEAVEAYSLENERVDRQCEAMISKYLEGKDKKVNEADIAAFTDPYRKNNEVEIIDPLKIEEQIKALETYIDDFEANVDIVLSVSNSTTVIEV